MQVRAGKKIVTRTGEQSYRHLCKKIKNQYYVIGQDCIELLGRWYPKDSKYIVFNHSKKQWVLKNKILNMEQGIVDFENGKPVIGYFENNKTQNVSVIDMIAGSTFKCINEHIARKGAIEDVSTGNFYLNASLGIRTTASKIRNAIDNKQKGYNIEDNVEEMADKIKAYNEYPTHINKDVAKFAALLNDVTFGAELECIRGYLPEHIQYQTGVVVCRDGSLHDEDGTQGPEFTTIPLQGAKGVQSLINLCNALQDRTIVDKHCSMHLHLGNLPTSRVFLVALYKLAVMIQDELFAMFPYYKLDERKYAGKDKNYCKKLNKLSVFSLKNEEKESYKSYVNNNYLKLFMFLTNGVVPSKQFNRKLGIHPKGGEKWNKGARYHWINFLNTIFSKRNTIEFRLHTGTTNAQKVVSWLFICNAIVKTAMCRQADLLAGKHINLFDVLDYYDMSTKGSRAGAAMSRYLKEYVSHRMSYFRKDYERDDYMSNRELVEDKKFSYLFTGISEMFNK